MTPKVGRVDPKSNHRTVMALDQENISSYIQPDAYVSPTAVVIGNVTMNNHAAAFPNVVLRGDLGSVWMGAHNVIEEGTVVVATPEFDVECGAWVHIGKGSILTGCTIGPACVIGAGCVIEEGAKMGLFTRLEPKSVLRSGDEIPEKEVWGGNPARFVRTITGDESYDTQMLIERFYDNTYQYMREFLPYGAQYLEKERLIKANKWSPPPPSPSQ
eukprot:CAMPEP_0185850624 /NCGR_PEP_ID=MMETSP1354-20130828/4692_1 /TAXON_ID=708628 /ORGANISM="Erythrolobus madagascarensis, Strain CCMP3276" /LENGTH=214 /DNA_ID=CAMNT_0028551327 /DNA_START=63 /DNA_END=707 /DNA_ORIENTATION=+